MTSPMVPPARPEMARSAALLLLSEHGVTGPALLGRRGYYRDTMGVPGQNDRGIYDDAIVVVTPTAYVTFNANCDPSVQRRGIAVLEAGVWRYKIGIHNASKNPQQHPHYTALVDAEEMIVRRDDTDEYEAGHVDPDYGACLGHGRWKGWFAIHIHCGSYRSTSSEGCQTIYPNQWEAFIALVESEMHRHELLSLPYVLTEREDASATSPSSSQGPLS